MKFLYEYRTSDNVKHDGVIRAADREAAYAVLKAQGIKPSRFSEAPGFFNKILGKGKRWIAIGVLLVLSGSLAGLLFVRRGEVAAVGGVFDSQSRRQLIGDAAEIELGIRTGWADVFKSEGDRFLASFAIPGVPAGQRNTTEEKLREALEADTVVPASDDSLVTRQICAIVSGMKREINGLLASGWTMKEVGGALVQRQERELRYFNLAKKEVDAAWAKDRGGAASVELWRKRNAELRNMGIRLIPLPDGKSGAEE